MTIKASIRSHPVLSYYALAFAISWSVCDGHTAARSDARSCRTFAGKPALSPPPFRPAFLATLPRVASM